MKINTVALIGAGAIGCYFISCLSEKLQDKLWIVAEGERKARLEQQGVVINDKPYRLNVRTPEEARGTDLIIVGVKYGALQEALAMVEKMVEDHSLVISPMNGVDSEQLIGAKIGMDRLMYTYMFIASQRVGNSVRFDPERTIGLNFGELDGRTSQRTEALEELFAGTDFHYRMTEQILHDIWAKYALNISRNLPQALINVGQGAYEDSEHLAYISNRLRDEVVAVAEAYGVNLADCASDKIKKRSVPPKARFSTLQDLDAKRETEIEMFSGALCRLAAKLRVAVPYNEYTYHAIKCLEEKNSGKIE